MADEFTPYEPHEIPRMTSRDWTILFLAALGVFLVGFGFGHTTTDKPKTYDVNVSFEVQHKFNLGNPTDHVPNF